MTTELSNSCLEKSEGINFKSIVYVCFKNIVNSASFLKESFGKIEYLVYILWMYSEKYFTIYLWPQYKNTGWNTLHVDLVIGFTVKTKMLVDSLLKL